MESSEDSSSIFLESSADGVESSSIFSESTAESADGSVDSSVESSSESSVESSLESSVESAESADSSLPTQKPDENKTVLREEVDDIGHKVVYYTDGTHEDLGRVVALDFGADSPEEQYGYQSFAKESASAGLCGFYNDLYAVATEFHTSTQNLTVEYDEDEYGEYAYAELAVLDYGKYGISLDQASAVWKVFGDENSIFYWLDIFFFYDDVNGEFYLLVDPAYASASVRKQANAAIEKMALECDGYLSGLTSETERALTIYDYLVDKIDYAYEADGETVETESWAYNIAGGATKGLGVCECYAETYAYFCGLFGIECLNVVGYADFNGYEYIDENDGHAWNYLQLDGKWYAVDATWGDDPTYNDRNYFGVELSEYNDTHIVDLPTAEWGVSYQCALPTLSKGLCPVLVGKEGEERTMAASLDEAFKLMTDEGGRYEVILYPDTTVTEKQNVRVYPQGATVLETTTLPKVAHITFVNGSGERGATIETLKTLTLQCGITMDGLQYTSSQWRKNGYTIN